jgi:phospholipase/carboxylesterase
MIAGIHHTTGITGNSQANVDFYADLLGLKLVKRTVNHNDSTVLHLFYGDSQGNPGTLLSFFAWEDTAAGRRGVGQAIEIGLIVPRESMGDWMQRLLSRGVSFQGPTQQGAESVLSISDPDGLTILLVGIANAPRDAMWFGSTVPLGMQVRGIHHVTFLSDNVAETGAVLERYLGFQRIGERDGLVRYQADAEVGHTVFVREASGFWPAADGVGTLQHVAFRTEDILTEQSILAAVKAAGLEVSEVREHGYFQSIYFREPGGSLIEVATESPGFTLDESPTSLGARLVLPPAFEYQRQDIEAMMPRISLPGEERIMKRDLDWIHRYQPGTNGWTLLLLHGTGGNETSLLALGKKVAPEATLLSVRGRSLDEGSPRFFRRFSMTQYDQAHLNQEANALAEFVREAADVYSLDPTKIVALGYSNGANIAIASLARNPKTYAGAVLLRPVMPFEEPPQVDLSGLSALVANGVRDSYLPYAEAVAPYLRNSGAEVQEERLAAGHELTEQDITTAAAWLQRLSAANNSE